MAVYALLICAVLLDAGSLASSKQIVADHSGYPPDRSSICEDEALTKGYKCEDYDVKFRFNCNTYIMCSAF